MKRLPIDLQSFEILHEDNCLYIDKTRFIHQMLEQGRYFFMSRPRRFGKSLMVSVLRYFFQNRRELFEGLWIAEHGNWKWEEYPVIMLDFNVISLDTPENLRLSLNLTLDKVAAENKIQLDHPLLSGKFEQLILALHKKTGKRVVILIDEYDKPIITHLGREKEALEIAKANRDILKQFLGTLKGADVAAKTRFVFITGVSKFSRVSIFSDLNNLIDISMNKQYADMLGYTAEELRTNFKPHIKALADEMEISQEEVLAKLKHYYDGYRFSESPKKVYNPFSVLRAFSNLAFKNYWFETGPPTFLINLLRERNYELPRIESVEVDEEAFSVYELERLSPEALLFQTGYLTIKDIIEELYVLSYPNHEVKKSFLKHLYFSFTETLDGMDRSQYVRLSEYLKKGDLDAFFETVNAIYASIAYTLKTEKNEAYFHTLFYLMVSASGMNVQSEVLTSRGRIDLLVEFTDKIYLMEFKCNRSAKAGIKQIHEKGYAEKYRQSGKKLILMGINFSSDQKNVTEWEIESQ